MPGTMFQDVVSRQTPATRRWYAVPLSFAIHTGILAVFIVVPLIATDALPMPRTVLEYTMPTVIPVVEPPPLQSAPQSARSSVTPPSAVPLVAPDEIGPDTGLIREPKAEETNAIDQLVGSGFAPPAADVLPSPPPAPPSEPVRVGFEIKPPARTRYVAPIYPEIARRNGIQGVVIVEAIVSVEGRIQNARVLRSHPFLDEAALQAVRSWEYSPTLLNGRPTPVIMTVTVNFTLR